MAIFEFVRTKTRAFVLAVVLVLAACFSLLCYRIENGRGRNPDIASPLIPGTPTQPLSYREILPDPDGKPMPIIKIGFVDEHNRPVVLERVKFCLGYLKPWDGKFDIQTFGGSGWTLNGHNGFITGFDIGDGRDMQLRFLKADRYIEVIFSPDEKYEHTSFRTPSFKDGQLEYSVLVGLREKKARIRTSAN